MQGCLFLSSIQFAQFIIPYPAWHSETALVRGAGGFAAEQMLPRAQNTAAGQRAYARCPAVSL